MRRFMTSTKSLNCVSCRGIGYQRSKLAASQSPYDSHGKLVTRRDGGADQLPCGSRKSTVGGSDRSGAS